ncbi:hypothetical protein P7K49_005789 [Saguinus oedipus]|uniref:Uncharacterized protein n=1 Tax=Saguinus oedipus TaxID=9490 RepID=A0ABQ9W311_SAGOE|nr:hypothetical protein P7K49_005789 [Saguinus oedipus]
MRPPHSTPPGPQSPEDRRQHPPPLLNTRSRKTTTLHPAGTPEPRGRTAAPSTPAQHLLTEGPRAQPPRLSGCPKLCEETTQETRWAVAAHGGQEDGSPALWLPAALRGDNAGDPLGSGSSRGTGGREPGSLAARSSARRQRRRPAGQWQLTGDRRTGARLSGCPQLCEETTQETRWAVAAHGGQEDGSPALWLPAALRGDNAGDPLGSGSSRGTGGREPGSLAARSSARRQRRRPTGQWQLTGVSEAGGCGAAVST